MVSDEVLREIEPSVRDAVAKTHPGVVFTDIWMKPRISWCGDDIVEIWAIYEGDVEDLGPWTSPSLQLRVQDILWDMGLDASPSTRLVAKADAEDLSPETV